MGLGNQGRAESLTCTLLFSRENYVRDDEYCGIEPLKWLNEHGCPGSINNQEQIDDGMRKLSLS